MNNVRLGRGHGYYDRFLCGLPDTTKTIGLAFDFQVVDNLPKDSHDIPVWKTITA
jgi:5-formyltetrahydrofolate cyclo-ligase